MGYYPLALRLYLPESWISQPQRLLTVRVPAEAQVPKTKGEIALELLDLVRTEGLPHQAVVADAGYGIGVDFRHGLEERGEAYVVGIAGQEAVFTQPPSWAVRPEATERGRPPTRWYITADTSAPVAVQRLAQQLERAPSAGDRAPKVCCTPSLPGCACGQRIAGRRDAPPTMYRTSTPTRVGCWSNGAVMGRSATPCPTCQRRLR